MRKSKFWSIMLMPALAICALSLFSSCSEDDESRNNGSSNIVVTVNEDGSASGGNIVSAIDDKNFYVNYIKYSVVEGHLEVTGYDRSAFAGEAKIISALNYKGNSYQVIEIAADAFKDCSVLTSVTIPNSVTSIGSSAFSGCESLTSIIIGNSVTEIGEYQFSGCGNLSSISVDKSNTTYSSVDGVLLNKDKTQIIYFPRGKSGEYSVPNSVTEIGEETFYGRSGLTSVIIPNSVTSIGSSAFSYCRGLTSVTIPNSVTSIGDYAFWDCYGLTSVTIPNSVTSIGRYVFYNCSGLTSVIIPNSVTSIGFQAFYGCDNLYDVTCLSTYPPYSSNYSPFSVYGTLHVLPGCGDAYRKYPWKDFTIVEDAKAPSAK